MTSILDDPVGRRALDRLLIDAETVRQNPELNRGFAAYITPDGHRARIDLVQAERVFSAAAQDQVLTLRRRLNDYLGDVEGMTVKAMITGANAEAADIRALTRSDQLQSWFIVPIGVFLVLLLALRDPLSCLNLVATMILTYAFALGATHLVFVTILGAEGIDWKVAYFLFVLLVAVGVDYNVFLMDFGYAGAASTRGLADGDRSQRDREDGGLITSAAAITACSFASFHDRVRSASLRSSGSPWSSESSLDALVVRPLARPVRPLADQPVAGTRCRRTGPRVPGRGVPRPARRTWRDLSAAGRSAPGTFTRGVEVRPPIPCAREFAG